MHEVELKVIIIIKNLANGVRVIKFLNDGLISTAWSIVQFSRKKSIFL